MDKNITYSLAGKNSMYKALKGIRIIELSQLIGDLESVPGDKEEKKLTEWQEFCRVKRLEGLQFKEIAKLWKEQKLK